MERIGRWLTGQPSEEQAENIEARMARIELATAQVDVLELRVERLEAVVQHHAEVLGEREPN